MADVIARDINFAYKENEPVLSDVNIEIPDGKFVCLLGQSGCGKSTFLRLVAHLQEPDKGVITYDGRMWNEGTEPDISVIFQNYGLFPWYTAGRNIVLALKQKFPAASRKELESRTKTYLEKVGLSKEVFNKYPFELSGGMQQRCAICQALCLDSSILLMDEPFGALDAVTRAHLQDMLIATRQDEQLNKTVLFVTHDVDESILLADRIIVLGLKPSRVIYQYDFQNNNHRNRAQLYTDVDVIELRNTLLRILGEDVSTNSRIKAPDLGLAFN